MSLKFTPQGHETVHEQYIPSQTTPTFLPIKDTLILFGCGSHGDRFHYKAEEGVVWSVWIHSPELP